MQQSLDFIYKKEVWFVSAFIHSQFVQGEKKSEELQKLIRQRVANITVEDLTRIKGPNCAQIKEVVQNMAKNITINMSWVPYIANFPYTDENIEVEYDTLGYFQFDVEYFAGDDEKKKQITPLMIQQIPSLVLNYLDAHERKEENKYSNFDTESPMFVFVTSDKTTGEEVQWSQENILHYKHSLGNWIEIYSGAWPDYSESLYDMRVQNNLSNRLSELHFIRRNSGFIYMAEENHRLFFNSYMQSFVLEPTARIRSMLFALICINHSLNILFNKRYSEGFLDLEVLEKKISNLKYLRGTIQTNLSLFYDELDYNRRQHYTAVLTHLIKEFELEKLIHRVNSKFSVIYDSIEELYQKKSEENQQQTERGLGMLNVLFGLGVIAECSGGFASAIKAIYEQDVASAFIYGSASLTIAIVLIFTLLAFLKLRRQLKKEKVGRTVDALILDDNNNIILHKREHPPFKGYHSLPGSFMRTEESEQQTLLRTIQEKIGIKVSIEGKVGEYSKKGRDPRGNIISSVYRCKTVGNLDEMRGEKFSKDEIKDTKLGFDHKEIIQSLDI